MILSWSRQQFRCHSEDVVLMPISLQVRSRCSTPWSRSWSLHQSSQRRSLKASAACSIPLAWQLLPAGQLSCTYAALARSWRSGPSNPRLRTQILQRPPQLQTYSAQIGTSKPRACQPACGGTTPAKAMPSLQLALAGQRLTATCPLCIMLSHRVLVWSQAGRIQGHRFWSRAPTGADRHFRRAADEDDCSVPGAWRQARPAHGSDAWHAGTTSGQQSA